MADNPSLSPAIVKRYNSLYSGVFHERFILGKWAVATGLVYPMFDKKRHVITDLPHCDKFFISCDYGTVNPSSFGLWGRHGSKWYRLREYYYDSKVGGVLRTDEEHYSKLCELAGDLEIEAIIVDPSAASFMECIRRHGRFKVIPAKNEVISGIRRVSESLRIGQMKFSSECKDTIREFSLYCWNEGSDAPKKENDHAMDDVRYFVSTILRGRGDDFFVLSASRK